MGSGDFGSNGSVHWNVRHTGSGQPVRSVDPVPYDDIGNEGGHRDFFRVTLKFEDGAAARTALDKAKITGNGIATILVPKIVPQRTSPVPPEVSVDW